MVNFSKNKPKNKLGLIVLQFSNDFFPSFSTKAHVGSRCYIDACATGSHLSR